MSAKKNDICSSPSRSSLRSAKGEDLYINARRTETVDGPIIAKLESGQTTLLFGRVNVINLIERSVLAITIETDDGEIIAHAAFCDYPNLESVDQTAWQPWLNQYHDVSTNDAINTLFLHYFVALPDFAHGAAQEIIVTAFNALPDLHNLFLMVPSGVYPESALADIFKPVAKREDEKLDTHVLFSCLRQNHLRILHVRPASVEDFDDLVPIFNRQSDRLKDCYGEFFLSELIEAQDDHMKCLVVEAEGLAVGFMSVTSSVDYALLNDCFELLPFHGLRKPHEDDVLVELSAARTSDRASDAAESPIEEEQVEIKTPTEESAVLDNESKTSADRITPSKASSQKASTEKASGEVDEKGEEDELPEASGEPDVKRRLADALHTDQGTDVALNAKSSLTRSELLLQSTLPESDQRPFQPVYCGDENAVCIQLFCIDERYEMRSLDFLPKMFSLFPGREFVAITVPHLVPEFPLLQQFVRVTPRPWCTLGQELYIFNRSALLSAFHVRPTSEEDLPAIASLVERLDLGANLLADVRQYLDFGKDALGTEMKAFSAICADQLVGISVLSCVEDIEYIQSHYNVESFIYFNHHRREEHANLQHFALNPVFAHRTRVFMKEILRLGRLTCLYHRIYPSNVDPLTVAIIPSCNKAETNTPQFTRHQSLTTAITSMVAVRARRQIAYDLDKLGENAPSERVLAQFPPFALYHQNCKLILEPKVAINARIIVVGASDTALSYLDTFTFSPHLKFNNLILVSTNGLPTEYPNPDSPESIMMADNRYFTASDIGQISLRTHVTSVAGKMTAIDRKRKFVTVNYKYKIPFDHVVLATGEQYLPPGKDIMDKRTEISNPEAPNKPMVAMANAFTINERANAIQAVDYVREKCIRNESMLMDDRALDLFCHLFEELNALYTVCHYRCSIIVYGEPIEAHCCVSAMLSLFEAEGLGYCTDKIVMIVPPRIDGLKHPSCFNNDEVEAAVLQAATTQQVMVYSGYTVVRWTPRASDDGSMRLDELVIRTAHGDAITFRVAAFFGYYQKNVDYLAFTAMNEACLVYDGRLVIDANFHTNDVTIRAAGPLTKFQRRYYADEWTHALYNSKEVGIQIANMMKSLFETQLASTMVKLFDPVQIQPTRPPNEEYKLVPIYHSPKIQSARLAGGFHYLHVWKPGLIEPLYKSMEKNDYGQVLTTGKPGGENGYFRLHLNQYKAVETITCLHTKPLPIGNYLCLFGLHARFLNNLISRFDEGLITDLYSYLSEPWAMALYHDRFESFRDEMRELMCTRPSANEDSFETKIRDLVVDDSGLSNMQRTELLKQFKSSVVKRAVETRMLSFLRYNHYHLPMYAKPDML